MIGVITGASRGLGLALASLLAKEGYSLNLPSRTPSPLVGWEYLDLTDSKALVSFITSLRSCPVDLLVNNAGYVHALIAIEEFDASELGKTLQVNFIAPIRLIQGILPGMKARGSGTIVNICSYSGRRGSPKLSVYSASKFALRGFTESLAKEIEGSGVRCFSVSPGGINTDMRMALFGKDDADKQQSPQFVAGGIADAITGRIHVPNGADLVIRKNAVRVVTTEE